MKTSEKMDVDGRRPTSDIDCRPVEKLSLVDVDHEKLSGVSGVDVD